MAATPGSGGPGGSAGVISYRDKTVKAHDRFWPEVDKVEPILADIKSKLHELSQSHLTLITALESQNGGFIQSYCKWDENLLSRIVVKEVTWLCYAFL